MNNPPKLGTILRGTETRDAIHIAITPIIAAHFLRPGTRVGVDDSGKANANGEYPTLGIVDPFLQKPVQDGETFYLFLFPGTITNMWHEWTHPSLPQTIRPSSDSEKEASKTWLTEYAALHCPYCESPVEAFGLFISRVEEDDHIYYCGEDLHSQAECDRVPELFHHLSVYLGRPVVPENFTFTCSC